MIVGTGMGGYLALAVWRRHRARVRALGLIATRAGADTGPAVEARLEMAERARSEGIAFVPQVMLPRLLGATTRATGPEVVERVTRLILEQRPDAVAAAQRGMASRGSSSELLDSIDVPTLVVAGLEDEIVSAAELAEIARRVQDSRLVEISSAGHLVNLERAEPLNRAVYQFVAELGQTTQ